MGVSGLSLLVDGGPEFIRAERVLIRWGHGADAMSLRARERIEEKWALYLDDARTAGRTLFDGPIYWMISARGEADGITVDVGEGRYRDFVVTVLRDRPWFQTHESAAMRPALGNSVLVVRGDRAILGVRSGKVSAYPARGHVIGGVLDRLSVIGHLREELAEELGIKEGEMHPAGPRLMGIVRDEFLGQPELVWIWETTVELENLLSRIEGVEHAGGIIIDRTGGELPVQLTPLAEWAVERWRHLRR